MEWLTVITLQTLNEIMAPDNGYLGPQSHKRESQTYMPPDGRLHNTTYEGFLPQN